MSRIFQALKSAERPNAPGAAADVDVVDARSSSSSRNSVGPSGGDMATVSAKPPVHVAQNRPERRKQERAGVKLAASAQRVVLLRLAILVVLVGLLYRQILPALARDWWNDPNFSHGFFVPLFSLFVVWQSRKKLSGLALRPHWFGLVVIVGALVTLVVGVLGAELFLSRSSLVLLLAGLIIYFAGWGHFRALLFPWAVLFLMIPIPVILFNQITIPLQFMASRLATWLLGVTGVPVLREGNVIHLPVMSLEVVEACSGIRSLVSLVTLTIIYGYLLETSTWRRIILGIAAIPVAVVANGLRIMGAGLLGQYWGPDKAEGFFHSFSGFVIFTFSLGMLYLFHRCLSLLASRRRMTA